MTYTGDVSPGGDADVRELAHLTITKVAVDPQMSNNCYLLHCRDTGEQVLIDAADDAATLLPLVGDAGLTTVDHDPPALGPPPRARRRRRRRPVPRSSPERPTPPRSPSRPAYPSTRSVSAGDTVAVGSCTLEVIPIAGHTPGSIALLYDDPSGHPHLWTGDSLFPGGVGNTFGDEAAFAQLIDEVETKLFGRLPDDTWFYPGHGNDSTIGAERASPGRVAGRAGGDSPPP